MLKRNYSLRGNRKSNQKMKTASRSDRKETNARLSAADQAGFFTMVKKYLRPYSGTLALLLLTYAFFTILTALQPLAMAPILDIALRANGQLTTSINPDVAQGGVDLNNIGQFVLLKLGLQDTTSWNVVLIMASAYLVMVIGTSLLSFINYLLAIKIRIGAGRDIQVDLFGHLFGLSLDFFNKERTGEIMARLDQDTSAAISGLELALRNLFVSPLLVAYYGYLMFVTNVNLTLFVAGAGILHYFLTRVIRSPIRLRLLEQFKVTADVTAFLQEKLTGARLVKSFVAEGYERSRLQKMSERVKKANLRFGFFKHVDEPVVLIVNALTNVGILLFSASELFKGNLTAGGFLLYLFVGRSILGPLTTLTQTYNSLQATLAAGVRVRELFAVKPSVVSGIQAANEFRALLELENVSFSYADSAILKNINLKIRKGETVAFVGPSGAGKSTLMDLLLRFYDPQSGQILLDGVNLKKLRLSEYRRLFGVVAQESFLFNATISENIAYAKDLSRAEIEEAAQIANAHEFILGLPNGYDTHVGDRGVRLSGGQRQRIAIARAMAHRPKILILDEATSSLDTESEKKVQVAVDQAIHSTTAVVIAHRLSTVVRADSIVVLDKGEIVDIGKHKELMDRCALYQRLANMQFTAEVEKPIMVAGEI
jgi:subfamily B ATP-binding cassette protein MsbA